MSEPLKLDVLSCAARLVRHGFPYCLPSLGGPDSGGHYVTGMGDMRRITDAIRNSHEVTLSQPEFGDTPVSILTINGKSFGVPPQFECRPGDRICVIKKGTE